MTYVVIARRWRPQVFEEIIGQDHVSRTLSNAIKNDRIAHAYIFAGPRGVGKTTSARIYAKALNCEKGPTAIPCNECTNCKEITRSNSMDVLEIDGASNNSVDEIRNLRENIRFTPANSRYKIYIIDEVHMLSKSAFNALLKTLEEPPKHAIFMFATTEIMKVPATILSRCQRFDFHRIPIKTIIEHLQNICKKDTIKIDNDSLIYIAKKADGSMRDAQSTLDQIISFCGEEITFAKIAETLGIVHTDVYLELTGYILSGDLKNIILQARDIYQSGYDLYEFMQGLEEHFRHILVTRALKSTEILEISENYNQQYKDLADKIAEADLIRYLQVIGQTITEVRFNSQPFLKFELGLLKMAKLPASLEIDQLLENLSLLKKKARNPVNSTIHQPEINQTSTPDISAIDQNWANFIQLIHSEKPSLATLFGNSKPESLQSGELNVLFPELNEFQIDLLGKNKSYISKCLKKQFNVDISFTFHAGRIVKKADEQKNKKAKKEDNKKILEELKKKDTIIAKLIDDFDLELI